MGFLSNLGRIDEWGSTFDDYVLAPARGEYAPSSMDEFTNRALPVLDPALYQFFDDNAHASATVIGDIAKVHEDNPFLGWQEDEDIWGATRRAADKDRQDTGRWTENTAVAAGAVLSGMNGGAPAWFGGGLSAAGAAAQGGGLDDIVRAWARGTIAANAGSEMDEYLRAQGFGAAAGKAGGAATASASGTAMAGGSGKDVATAGVLGGLSAGYMPDAAGAVGIEDPLAGAVVNNGLRGAAMSAVRGGNSQENTMAGITSAAPALGSYLFTPNSTYAPTNGSQYLYNDITQQSHMPLQETASYFRPEGYQTPQQSQVPAYVDSSSPMAYNNNPYGEPANDSSLSQGFTDFLGSLMPSDGAKFGNTMQGLAGLYSGYRRYRDARAAARDFGANRGAYAEQLQRQLARRDAAAGRRSNYEGRAVELQAALANLDSRNAPNVLALNNARHSGLDSMLRSGLSMGSNLGYFGPQRAAPMVVPQNNGVTSFVPRLPPDVGYNFQLSDLNQ